MAFINLVIEANYDVPQTLHHIKVTKTYGEIPVAWFLSVLWAATQN